MKVLITAGPTREPIDAVRFISNRSSGRMGLALAQAAVEAGHDVTLLLGPGPDDSEAPRACRLYRFESSAQLQQLLDVHFAEQDLLVMAAAVADYRPTLVQEGKLPRQTDKPLVLKLDPTPDLVAMMVRRKKPHQRVVAFALEEAEQLESRALAKMKRKQVDAIVANPLGTMEASGITAVLLWADGRREAPGRMSKREMARWLMQKLGERPPSR